MCSLQTVQNRHNDDDEMAKKKFYGRATSQSSGASQFSDAETEMTTIDFNGSPLVIKCSPLKVLQFLILDLQHKIKAFVPDGKKIYYTEMSALMCSITR